MRSAGSARTQLLIGTSVALFLVGGILASTTDGTRATASTPVVPEFFSFNGAPFDDGLNHYLVTIESTTVVDSDSMWVSADGALEISSEVDDSPIDLDALAAAIRGDGSAEVDTARLLSTHPEISAVRPLGFGVFAASGSIELDILRQLPGVAMVDVDTSLSTASSDPLYPSQWALENDGDTAEPWAVTAGADIDAPEGWHRTRGAGVVVAVIDSGVDVTHPDLVANIWHNSDEDCDNGLDDDGNGYPDDCTGWDFVNNDSTTEDLNGHGTHVAGIIGAEANNKIGIAGVAYEAQIMPLKIGDGAPPLSAAIEAIAYAIDNGARVINASWVSDDPSAEAFLQPALDAAEAAGVLFITGAGNFGTDIDAEPIFPGSANNPNVITVGASTAQDLPAEYSGFGSRSVDLFAPGEHIVSTLPGDQYGAFSGTSMAAPMVSGAAALLWSATPQATYAEVKGALLDRSDGPNDGVTSFRDLASSEGRLNIERSIYTRLFQPSLMYEFHDFNSFEPNELHDVAIVAKTVDPWIFPPQIPARYRLGLYVPLEGSPMGVVGQTVEHVYGGATTSFVTDGTGRAVIGPDFERQRRSDFVQSGDETLLRMSLPMGTYAVTTEVVDVTDMDNPVTMGEPSAVFFVIGIDGSVTQMPENPVGVGPTTTTTAPGVTTTVAGPSSTTAAPGSTTTSEAPGSTSTSSTTTTTVDPEDPDATTTTTTTTAGPEDPEGTTTTSTTTTTTSLAPSGTTSTTTTTTEAPTTTIPTGSTTTTLPPTTTTTIVDPDAPQITNVHPAEGPVSGGTLVTITGVNFPEHPLVDFGDVRASSIVSNTDKLIIVSTPRGTVGLVDVTVSDRVTDVEATFEDGFLYLDDGSAPTTTAATTTSIAPTTSSAPGPTSTTYPPSDGGSIDDWLGAVLVTPEGLTLAPPAPGDPINSIPVELWAGSLCDEPVCPGWVLQG
ncbi:MAG: S8 family serine peptidase [bacterium]|nr:S8 family serine peptidase [bacterium]